MAFSSELEQRLYEEIRQIVAIDVHSHVPASEPFARSLRDLLGYHYFTELAHSAGMDKAVLAPESPDEEMIPRLLDAMERVDNTVQYGWMMELAAALFDFHEERLTSKNWEPLAAAVKEKAKQPGRKREILKASCIERTFLTNSPGEDLDGIDTEIFVPSLRADALVFSIGDPTERGPVEEATGITITDLKSVRQALASLFEKFVAAGARSVAIGLPVHFAVEASTDAALEWTLDQALSGEEMDEWDTFELHSGMLRLIAEQCRAFSLPMQVMYGVVRNEYRHGVPLGTDLSQAGGSLQGLLPLFNDFPEVDFLISILSASQAQELVSYGWIVHNVIVSGHWWYTTIPAFIESDLAARLQAVPKTKLIGYYSDMYKLEFGLPKFNMYRRVLARVLARDYVQAGYGTEEAALEMAQLMLRDNAKRIFNL